MVVREDVDAEARVMCKGYFGQTVAWLAPEGSIRYTTLRSDVFEVPRVPNDIAFSMGLGSTVEELVPNLEAETGLTAIRVVTWDELPYKGSYGPFPASVGIAFVERP